MAGLHPSASFASPPPSTLPQGAHAAAYASAEPALGAATSTSQRPVVWSTSPTGVRQLTEASPHAATAALPFGVSAHRSPSDHVAAFTSSSSSSSSVSQHTPSHAPSHAQPFSSAARVAATAAAEALWEASDQHGVPRAPVTSQAASGASMPPSSAAVAAAAAAAAAATPSSTAPGPSPAVPRYTHGDVGGGARTGLGGGGGFVGAAAGLSEWSTPVTAPQQRSHGHYGGGGGASTVSFSDDVSGSGSIHTSGTRTGTGTGSDGSPSPHTGQPDFTGRYGIRAHDITATVMGRGLGLGRVSLSSTSDLSDSDSSGSYAD